MYGAFLYSIVRLTDVEGLKYILCVSFTHINLFFLLFNVFYYYFFSPRFACEKRYTALERMSLISLYGPGILFKTSLPGMKILWAGSHPVFDKNRKIVLLFFNNDSANL